MNEEQSNNSTNRYRELENRTTEFAKRVVRLCKALPRDRINNRLVDQIIRSAGSVGANYREANEALGKKDFIYRLRIARKEAKETHHWFELIEEANPNFSKRMKDLFQEIQELRNILSSIITKAEDKKNKSKKQKMMKKSTKQKTQRPNKTQISKHKNEFGMFVF